MKEDNKTSLCGYASYYLAEQWDNDKLENKELLLIIYIQIIYIPGLQIEKLPQQTEKVLQYSGKFSQHSGIVSQQQSLGVLKLHFFRN